MSVDTLIYVKRYDHGLWADERELDIAVEAVDEFLAQEREYAVMLSNVCGDPPDPHDGDSTLADEVVRYHAAYQPHERAECVYRWNAA